MSSTEYLSRYIEAGKRYEELPPRLRAAVGEDEWRRRVVAHCVRRGFGWAGSLAAAAAGERDYYEALLAAHRRARRLFPHHLAGYVCRVMRATPAAYYRDMLADAMAADCPYDALPNFTAADAVRELGVGRNEYIAAVVAAKSRRLAWRVNRGAAAREELPAAPAAGWLAPGGGGADPWWVARTVNLTEPEFRSLDLQEAAAARAAAAPGGARLGALPPGAARQLYRRGLIYVEVPVADGDAVEVPPLEGFVSNRSKGSAAGGGAGGGGGDDDDPLDALIYQVLVAASDRATVRQLAALLQVDAPTLRVAVSAACRLRFARRVEAEADAGGAAPAAEGAGLDALLGRGEAEAEPSPPPRPPDGAAAAEPDAPPTAGAGVAVVVDAEVTGFLMMGALTPGCKRAAVTLFEGGRIAGTAAVAALLDELDASAVAAAGLEGELAALAGAAAALRTLLGAAAAAAGGRPLDVLRGESLAALAPAAAARVLCHAYGAVVPIAGLSPPLPVPLGGAAPVLYGPSPAAASPWASLAACVALGAGPVGVVLPAGARLAALPAPLAGCGAALAWEWGAAAARPAPAVPGAALLHAANAALRRAPLLLHPLWPQAAEGGGAGAGEPAPAGGELPRGVEYVDVPLPLPLPGGGDADGGGSGGGDASAAERVEGWGCAARGPPGWVAVEGVGRGGAPRPLLLPRGAAAALAGLGLGGAVGALRLLRYGGGGGAARLAAPGGGGGGGGGAPPPPRWVPLSLALGVPMAPPRLCAAVCATAAVAGFLEPAAARAHREGSARLEAELARLAASAGGRGGGGGAAPLPGRCLCFDGVALVPLELGAAAQGAALP